MYNIVRREYKFCILSIAVCVRTRSSEALFYIFMKTTLEQPFSFVLKRILNRFILFNFKAQFSCFINFEARLIDACSHIFQSQDKRIAEQQG